MAFHPQGECFQPLTANLLLAIGAVPAMLNDAEEAADMLRSGTCLLYTSRCV